MPKLSRDESVLLQFQGLYFFTDALAGVFVNIFLFRLGGFQAALLFNLLVMACLLFWHIISGWELRILSSRALIRFGLLCKATTYGLLFLLREHALPFIPLLAAINGTGLGHFWPSFNLTQYNLTHRATRSRYFGWFGSLLSLGQSVGPILGGSIIAAAVALTQTKTAGYAFLFFAVVVLTVVNIGNVRRLPSYTKVQFSFRHLLRHRRTRNWHLVLLQQFCIGLWDASFTIISGILIYLIVQGELWVGIVNTVTALLYTGVSLWAGKMLARRKQLLYIGLVGMPLGILLFALQQNWLGVLALVVVNGLAAPFLNIPPFVAFFNTMDELREPWQQKYHLFIERETVLDIPRVLTPLYLFFFLTVDNQVLLARQWITLIAVMPAVIGALNFLLFQPHREQIPSPELQRV